MSDIVIKVENLGKLYKLGEITTGTLSHDLNRWWAKVRGKEDPFVKIGQVNDRTIKGNNDWVWALKDINFEIKQGEVLGIIGKNGAGKSTLLKILSKVTTASTGQIKIKGRIASLLEVGTGFHQELTGRENIFLNGAILGMNKTEIKSKFDEIVDFSGVERYIDTPVKRYSSGMYVRLAFAVAAFLEPEILIVDEVLAVGDTEFQKKCLGRMKDVSVNDGRTVLFVSHNMAAMKSLCNKGVLLENGKMAFNGEIDKVISEYLRENSISNKVVFSKGPLNEVTITQKDQDLVIKAKYNSEIEIDIPNLGFVIYNEFGNPVFGGNPVMDNFNFEPEKKFKKGEIEVRIINPRLVDAAYTMSIWFGDSKENHFEALGCVLFEIKGMVNVRYVNTSYIGSVMPILEWKI